MIGPQAAMTNFHCRDKSFSKFDIRVTKVFAGRNAVRSFAQWANQKGFDLTHER